MEREEFASFYAASFQRLVGQLYAMIGDQAEAQDVVQEAFVRAWARRGKIDRNGAPEAWVRVTAWRIAANTSIHAVRSPFRVPRKVIPCCSRPDKAAAAAPLPRGGPSWCS